MPYRKFYFDSRDNLLYFFQSMDSAPLWEDLFRALQPGCGAVGNYTDMWVLRPCLGRHVSVKACQCAGMHEVVGHILSWNRKH